MRSHQKILAAANIFVALSLWASKSEAGDITYFTDRNSYQENNVGLNLSVLNPEANQVLSLLLDRRISDFFQEGMVALDSNEKSSEFGPANELSSTWSSIVGPLKHYIREQYRVSEKFGYENEELQSLWETHPSFPKQERLKAFYAGSNVIGGGNGSQFLNAILGSETPESSVQKLFWDNYYGMRFRGYANNRRVEPIDEITFEQHFFAQIMRGNDSIRTGSEDDTVFPGSGWNQVNLGDGYDSVEFLMPSKNYYINANYDEVEVHSEFNQNYLIGVEKLIFPDKEIEILQPQFWGFKSFGAKLDRNWGNQSYDYTINQYRYGYIANDIRNVPTTNVHRFYNSRDDAFFYTTDLTEAGTILWRSTHLITESGKPYDIDDPMYEEVRQYFEGPRWPYIYQGTTYASASYRPYTDSAVPLYRFYNYETGHHFFTADVAERDTVISRSDAGEWPFNYEGVAYNVYLSDPEEEITIDKYTLPVYRLYSSKLNRHFFTALQEEVDRMVEIDGWGLEGIGFWAEKPCINVEDQGVEKINISGNCDSL